MPSLFEDLFGPKMDLEPARRFYGPNFDAIMEWDRGYPERQRAYFAEQEHLRAMQQAPKAGFWRRLLGRG